VRFKGLPQTTNGEYEYEYENEYECVAKKTGAVDAGSNGAGESPASG
jgi:hypothetical protein